MIEDIDLEALEKEVFDYIIRALKQDLSSVIKGLNSRIEILNDWKTQFEKTARKNYKSSDLDTGAERIFHHLFHPMFRFPNSCPIGSDMMFKTDDAIIHIEVKTTLIDNPDYKGKVQLGRNQISYAFSPIFEPNLPKSYSYKKSNLPTLTYVIQIVHEHMKPKLAALNVICIPNGQLYEHYGPNILNAGKAGWLKANDIRYNYIKEPKFVLLSKRDNKNIFRIEILLIDENFKVKDITGKDIEIKPYKTIKELHF